jgi:hypothetical protein
MPSTHHNKLKGKFIECCDCYTICPCWVKDRPDEDHCSSLYIWTFDEDAQIEGKDIGGKSVAAAAFHWGDGERQSAIYVDDTLDKSTQQSLLDAFSGKTVKSLKSLAQLLGTVVDSGPAKIDQEKKNGKWEVTVTVNESCIAHAVWTEEPMEGRSQPLTLNDTALDDELGIDGAVTVQKVDRFEMAVSPLPGGPFVYSGRSGMAAKFNYSGRS